MAEDLSEIFINNYNKFIDDLKNIFSDENTLNILNKNYNDADDKKLSKGEVFSILVKEIDFNNFINCKIKIFSHKEDNTLKLSESLLSNELCLKNLLNNQPEDLKIIIWKHLHTIWLSAEYLNDNPNTDYIELIKFKLYGVNKTDAKQKLQELLNIEVNTDTTDMIDDIMNSFEDLLHNTNSENPMSNIYNISQTISQKYADKIKEGDIEIDKIMKSIMSKIPGMDNLFNNMDSFIKTKSKPDKVIIDENFSTSKVELGELPQSSNSMKIGSMLKIADSMGIIPGLNNAKEGENKSDLSDNLGNLMNGGDLGNIMNGSNLGNMMNNLFSKVSNNTHETSNDTSNENTSTNNNFPDINNLMNGLLNKENPLNFDKIINIMTKLNNTNTVEDANLLKDEMDSFLQKDLGLDISNFKN